MDLAPRLLHDLITLNTSRGGADPLSDSGLGSSSAEALLLDLMAAVPSACGFQLTIVHVACPVTLTAFVDEPEDIVRTSLSLPLVLVDPEFERGSRIILYARTSGAFVDLAADLDYGCRGTPPKRAHPAGNRGVGIRLDRDLPPSTSSSGLSGLAPLTVMQTAIGVMIARGHHPDHAHDGLLADAEAAGLDPQAWAVKLLGNQRRQSVS